MKKALFLFILIVVCAKANAQINILQNTIDNLKGYKNISYQYVYKQKEAFADTLVHKQKFTLVKAPQDVKIGYYFKYESQIPDSPTPLVHLYDGNNLISLNPAESTYEIRGAQRSIFEGSMLAQLNWIEGFLSKKPSKLILAADTLYNSKNSYHLIVNTKDTVINNTRQYVRIHLLIDKATGLLSGRFTRSRTADFGKEVTDYFTEDKYFNYKINDDDISTALFSVPAGFSELKKKPATETALLKPGIVAPDWTLEDTDGAKTSLSKLKGKVILLDFFFVGCTYCFSTLAPLDRLDKKYKNKGLEILSISNRDNNKLLTKFKKVQKIKNKMYPNGSEVAKLYHMTDAPTFYFIDRQGKIASVVNGYSDDFEKKMTAIIDGLL